MICIVVVVDGGGLAIVLFIMIMIRTTVIIRLVLLRNYGDGFDLPADDGTVESLGEVAAVLCEYVVM